MPITVDITRNGKIISRVAIYNAGAPENPATETERLYNFEHDLPHTPGAILRTGTVRHDRNEGVEVLVAKVMAHVTKRTLLS